LAKMLTDVPGASEYFKYGWITYSNSAKTSELNVHPDLIEKYGAVSEQVAEAMAKGARKKAGADFAIGITGIAGPTGGTEQKPIGLVYISVDSSDFSETNTTSSGTNCPEYASSEIEYLTNCREIVIMEFAGGSRIT
jgi:PncC family amidohydrolase